MKKIFTLLFLLLSASWIAQTNTADNILGTYMTAENEAMVEITKKSDQYFGKILWNKTTGKKDINNPDEKQRGDLLAGKEILKNFIFDGKDIWAKGTIYDPKNGKTYSCKITRDEKGNLNVRGFVGVSMLGRTSFWVKVK